VVLIRAMSDKPHALSTVTPAPRPEADYDALRTIVSALPQGRWFLEEYARRVRDTDPLPDKPAPPASVFAVAERLQDLVWTMRERGLAAATCAQIEELARIILQAPGLRDPQDRRGQKLAEVLCLLEARIEAMLASAPTAETGADTPDVLEAQPLPAPAADPPPPFEIAAPEIDPIQAAVPAFTTPVEPKAEWAATPPEPAPADFLLESLPHGRSAPPPHGAVGSLPEDIESELFASVPAWPAQREPKLELEVEPDSECDAKPQADLQAQLEQQLAAELEFGPASDPELEYEPAPLPAVMPQAAPTTPAVSPTPRSLLIDPLAALRAMSDEERIALFT
jgi:hypothetical protein